MRPFLFLLLTFALSAQDVFVTKPYLQLGNFPSIKESGKMAISWHTSDEKHDFTVVHKNTGSRTWSKPVVANWQRIAVRTIDPHLVWTANLTGLMPGKTFDYRIFRDGKKVFEATAKARKSAS